jgi:ribosome-associated heat shock protein Hsp15
MSRQQQKTAHPRPADGSGARLDRWLWAARFYKTRTLSQEAIDGGKVRYDGDRSKASKSVQIGARIALRQGWDDIEVVVKALSEKRGGAPEARLLYEETPESIERREKAAEQRRLNAVQFDAVRPDKKQRRLLEKLKRRLIG